MPVVYNIGDQVEVCSQEEGFRGSYYAAVVVFILRDGRYKVEYKTLIENEETRIPLKEVVLPMELRPRPPRVRTLELRVSQSVDAFANDGWWTGVIIEQFDSGEYYVYFRSTGQALAYHPSLIRVHQDFIDGHWC